MVAIPVTTSHNVPPSAWPGLVCHSSRLIQVYGFLIVYSMPSTIFWHFAQLPSMPSTMQPPTSQAVTTGLTTASRKPLIASLAKSWIFWFFSLNEVQACSSPPAHLM